MLLWCQFQLLGLKSTIYQLRNHHVIKYEINYHVVYINHVVISKLQIERVKFNYFVVELEIIE